VIILDKITIILAIWIIILLFITDQVDFEVFFILVLLGFLFIIEFTERFITKKVKQRLRIILIVFIMIFIVFAANKIITFLGM
jgi:hypothetical protein